MFPSCNAETAVFWTWQDDVWGAMVRRSEENSNVTCAAAPRVYVLRGRGKSIPSSGYRLTPTTEVESLFTTNTEK